MEPGKRQNAMAAAWLPFGITAILLIATIIGVNLPRGSFIKAAAPLRKPLDRLDKDRLGPWTWKRGSTIESAVLNTLGTDLYIDWQLENESRSMEDPLRYCYLFITYYTGKPDLVPHTPEVCYSAGGYELTAPCESQSDVLELTDGASREIPYRYCTFKKTNIFAGAEFAVLYTFHANGRIVSRRSEVRSVINELSANHAYFSKIELKFGTPDGRVFPSHEESINEAKEVLSILLPLLEEEHFPDWEALEKEAIGDDPESDRVT